MATSSWNESSFDWLWTSGGMRVIHGSGYLIEIYNDVDLMDAGRHSIYVSSTVPRY